MQLSMKDPQWTNVLKNQALCIARMKYYSLIKNIKSYYTSIFNFRSLQPDKYLTCKPLYLSIHSLQIMRPSLFVCMLFSQENCCLSKICNITIRLTNKALGEQIPS